MKKAKLILGLSLASIFAAGVVSCNPTPTPVKESPKFLTEEAEKAVTLPSSSVIETESSEYFTVYVVRDVEGKPELVTSGGDTLVTPGKKYGLYAYGVPEGYSLGITLLNAAGEKVNTIDIKEDGSFVAPNVSSRTDFVIQLYAKSPTKVLSYNGETFHRIIRKSVNLTVVPSASYAAGDVFRYDGLNEKERSIATAELEGYGMKHGLTGVSLTTNGGYVLYNDRVSAPLLDNNTYLAGYGWGLDLYGKINKGLDAEHTEAYKNFYHEQIQPADDPGNINYLNSNLATVSDLYGRISSSYFYTPLNENYTAYEYRGNLSRVDAPIPLNMDESGTATKWKIPLRVGASSDGENGQTKGLTYRTNTKEAKFAKYDKRNITIDDYLTTFKLLATKSIGWYRGAEQAGESTASRQIKGFSEFYNGSGNLKELPTNEEFSKSVGVSVDKNDNSITIEFNAGFTQEFAIYQIDSLWSNPMCEEFIKELGNGNVIEGAKIYGTSPAGLTPFDTSLSVGPTVGMTYESKKTIAFQKNQDWFLKKDAYGRDIYNIEGYHININSALETDANAGMVAFENGKVDSATITSEYWDKYVTDPRKKQVEGDRQQKLTFNTSDKVLWEYYWGEGGMWQQKFNKDNSIKWHTKPIASNRNFFYGLNLGIDRVAYSEKYHAPASIDYMNPINKVNPATPNLYNNSEEHKAAVKGIYGNKLEELSKTPDYAVDFMETAILEELEAGHYELGTEDNPTVVSLGIGSIDDTYYKDRIALIEQNWATAFQKAVQTHVDSYGESQEATNSWVGVNGKPLIKFELQKEYVPSDISQQELITKGLWAGKFDIQYAYLITGNAYDTLNGLDILKSNDLGGFELNFGVDTSIPSPEIEYDNKYWSFDSFWQATQGGVVVDENGKVTTEILEPNDESVVTTKLEDGSIQFDFNLNIKEGFNAKIVEGDTLCADSDYTGYKITAKISDLGGGKARIVIPKEGLIPASLVGLSDYEYYVDFQFEYDVTGSSGKVATYSSTWGFVA